MRFLLTLSLLFSVLLAAAQPAYIYDEKGTTLYNQGKYVEAIAQFDLAIKTDATYFEAFLHRGQANLALGKNDLALNDFTKTTQLNANYAPGFFYKAKVEHLQANDQAATADYSQAIKLNADYTEAYMNRGQIYMTTTPEPHPLALADFNKVIALDAKNAEAYYQRGIIYTQMNKTTEALADFSKAVSLDANMGKAYFEEGKIHATQKKNDLALSEFSKAITLGVSNEDIYKRRAEVNLALGKTDDAIKDYSYIIETLHSTNADMYRLRGELFLQQKNYPSAIRDFNKALVFKKDDITTLLDRGDANYAQGKTKYAAAELDYKKVLTLDATNVRAARSLSTIYFEQEKWQLCIDNLDIVIKNGATAADYDMRGKCYWKLNNKKSACEDLSKAEQMGYPDAAKDKLNAGCK